MTQLVILEDAPVRLELFKLELLDVDYTVTHSVTQFVKDLENAGDELRLVIMDHDLGHAKDGQVFPYYDQGGLNGSDAARLMPEVNVPIVVWSVNSEGAAWMVAKLRERGMSARWIPVFQANDISFVLRTIFPPKEVA